MTLIPQNILYENSHNGTTHSGTWYRHNKEFSEFIKFDATSNVIEVGGTGTLLLEVDHKILDIVDNGMKNYIQGNCEDFDFGETDVIIMSHVFEHLYNPSEFIKNCYKYNVGNIFISHPVMSGTSPIIPIHTEHTYFADELDVIHLFEKNNYRTAGIKNFENHSLFFHFKCETGSFPTDDTFLRPERSEEILFNFEKRRNLIEAVDIDDETYIMPAGHFGQIVYYYLKNKKIKGFIDNDSNKQNKRVYGTPLMTFSLTEVNPKNIILYAGAYSTEIREQIRLVHPTCNVLVI
jgi:hypothetical protein